MLALTKALFCLGRASTFALALLLSASSGIFAQPSEPLIRVGAGPDDPSIPLLYAAQNGLFAKAGLNVEIVRLPGAAAVAAALAGGSLEIGKGATMTIVQAITKGLPFTIIGNAGMYNSNAPDVALVVLANSPIKSAKDFNGKIMAGISIQDQQVVSTLAWLDQNGGDSSTLKYIEVPASASLAAMEQGRITGSTLYEPILTAALETGKVRIVGYPYDAVGKRWSDVVLFANVKWVSDHRETVARFLRVVGDASTYVAAHEAEMGPLQAQYGGVVDQALVAKIRHAGRGVAIDPAELQPILDIALRYRVLERPIKANDLICSCALRKDR